MALPRAQRRKSEGEKGPSTASVAYDCWRAGSVTFSFEPFANMSEPRGFTVSVTDKNLVLVEVQNDGASAQALLTAEGAQELSSAIQSAADKARNVRADRPADVIEGP